MMENEMQLNIRAPLLSIRKHLSPRATTSETARIVTEKSPVGGHLSLLVDKSEWESEEVTKPAAVPFLWERVPGLPKGDCLYHYNKEPGITPRPPPARLSEVCTLRPPPGGIHNARNVKGEACNSPRPPLGRLFEVCTFKPPPGEIHKAENSKDEKCPPRPSLGRLFEVCTFRPPPGAIHNAQNSKGEACPSPRPPPRRLFEVCNYTPPRGEIHNVQTLSVEACPSSKLLHIGRIFGEIFSPKLHPMQVPRAGGVDTPRLTSGKLTNARHMSGGKSIVQNNRSCQVVAFTTTDHSSLLQSFKECLDADEESDKDNGDDAFYDALDTLSPNESLSLRSSVSGLSSSYHQNYGSSRNYSVDLQARAFMMSRFLPAAKAAEVHDPQHVVTNPTVVIGEQKTLQEFIDFERKPLLKQPGLNERPSSNKHMEYLKHEDVEYDHEPEIRIGKTCGVFQRLCVNNFVTHLNPKSGMKLKPQSSKPSSGKVKKATRIAYCQPVHKCVYDATCKKLYPSDVTSQELPKVRNMLACKPKRIASSSNSFKMADIIPPTIPRSSGIYPIRNEKSPSLFSEGGSFLALPKPIEPKTDEISPLVKRDHHANIEVSAQCSNRQGFEPQVLAAAKTMYEDTRQKKVKYIKLNSSKSQKRSNSLTNLETMAGSDAVCDFGSTGMASTSTCNSRLPAFSPIMEKCNQEHHFLAMEELKDGESLVNGQEESSCAVPPHPLPLPVPKSPSESWLWHTIPSTDLQNSFSHSHGHSRLQCVSKNKQPSKWEKLVKSSKRHHDHFDRLLDNVDKYSEISDA